MGMYTYFIIKGTVKEKYREKMNLLYTDNSDKEFDILVDEIGFDLLKEFSKGERAGAIFYGSRSYDDPICEWNKETGELHLEINIKNYAETGKPKNSMDLFVDIIPELFEEGLFFSSQYEDYDVPFEYELRNGELVITNEDDYKKEIDSWRI